MTDPSPAQGYATPITRNDGPAGSQVLSFESVRAGFFEIRGRVVADDLPCTVGGAGCGQNTMVILRAPMFGLNLPGEQIVGTILHCSVCGPSDEGVPRLVTPTSQEFTWGWAPGTVG
ncbi:hypothetical protein [Amycolatopsis saalfeldensis]|uniref:Uncharacterized protein n=1 Tax=Amycolatopsis saalfeldensis TaxID=394193 RepID=A0A1H8YR41_9PSEU|nr:hypothetical protein [Amycolatopsis saalfeldensis]SEP54563.1 hypothetical protein SAMN04489732_1568 [Amycolatopsis saalfeldensis]